MHSNRRHFLLLTLALLLLVAGCKEDQPDPGPQLPPETQTGAGTLGFKIGDRIYVAKRVTGQEIEPGTFVVNSGGYVEEGWACAVMADSIAAPGNYVIDTLLRPGSINPGSAGIYQTTSPLCIYMTNVDSYKGNLEISYLNYSTRIISGKFFFKANSNNCGLVQVTEGRFDVKF